MKRRLICLLAITISLTAALAACSKPVNRPEEATGGADTETVASATRQDAPSAAEKAGLPDGVTIETVFPYSGAYVEDGSNAACENVCAILLYNDSPVHYQYLRFSLETAGGVYTFAASTLFAGARMTVLCEEKAPFAEGEVLSAALLTSVPFQEPPSVHTDTLEITYADGFINVKNRTDAALSNVYVYFKDTDGNGYLGGSTYRASFGEIPAGGTVQTGAANMRRATCRVVFATYDT